MPAAVTVCGRCVLGLLLAALRPIIQSRPDLRTHPHTTDPTMQRAVVHSLRRATRALPQSVALPRVVTSSRTTTLALLLAASTTTTTTIIHPSVTTAHMMSSVPTPTKMPATADLCDDHEPRLQVAEGNAFRSYGQHASFGGQIVTIKCFENNPLVRSILSEPGQGKVLVVDGGGSLRRALFGDNIAALAVKNGWAGVIIYGAIRDSAVVDGMPFGVKALGTNPIKSSKQHPGDRDVVVAFAGVTFMPGHYVYADRDGIVVSETALH